MSSQAQHQLTSEEDALRAEIAEIVLYPDSWLETPNDQLGGRAPKELLDTPEDRDVLENLVQGIKHGMIT